MVFGPALLLFPLFFLGALGGESLVRQLPKTVRSGDPNPRSVSLSLAKASRIDPEPVSNTNGLFGALCLLFALDVSSFTPGSTSESLVGFRHGVTKRSGGSMGLSALERKDIPAPLCDARFDPSCTGGGRIPFEVGQTDGTGDHVSGVTGVVDASFLYSGAPRNGTGGRLATAGKYGDLPPVDPATGLIDGAPATVSLDPIVQSLYVILLREHNAAAGKIAAALPDLTDQQVFDAAKPVVAHLWQQVVNEEVMPTLVGPLPSFVTPTTTSSRPVVSHAFAVALVAVALGKYTPIVARSTTTGTPLGALQLRDAVYVTSPVCTRDGDAETVLMGMVSAPSPPVRPACTDAWTGAAVTAADGIATDLCAVIVNREREMGVPGYAAARSALGLSSPSALADGFGLFRPAFAETMRSAYGNAIGAVDLITGALAEPTTTAPSSADTATPAVSTKKKNSESGGTSGRLGALDSHITGVEVGETLRKLLTDDYLRLRSADPAWYERTDIRRTRAHRGLSSSTTTTTSSSSTSNAEQKTTYVGKDSALHALHTHIEPAPATGHALGTLIRRNGRGLSDTFPREATLTLDPSKIGGGGGSAAAVEDSFKSTTLVIDRLRLEWRDNPDDASITFKLTSTTGDSGWVGFGFTAGAGSKMVGADIVIGTMEGGVGVVRDYRATGFATPRLDTDRGGTIDVGDDATFVSSGGVSVLTFTRKYDTGDEEDNVLDPEAALTPVLFATGSSFALVQHPSGNSGSGSLPLFSDAAASIELGGISAATYIHGIGMTVAWLVAMPVGVYFVRYKKTSSYWLSMHKLAISFGTSSALPLALSAAVRSDAHATDYHTTAAYAFVLIALAQVIIGAILAGTFKTATYATKMAKVRIVHRWSGRVVFCTAIGQVGTGFRRIGMPMYGWGIGLVWLLFLVFLYAKEEFKRRQASRGIDAASLIGVPIMSSEAFEAGVARGMEWVIIDGIVLDVAGWATSHPGGAKVLQAQVGNDVTDIFHGRIPGSYGHSDTAARKTESMAVAIIHGSSSDAASHSGAGGPVDLIPCKVTSISFAADDGSPVTGSNRNRASHVFLTAEPAVRVPFPPRIRPGHHLEVAVNDDALTSRGDGAGPSSNPSFPATRLLTPTRASVSADPRLDFMVRLIPGGALSEYLRRAQLGTVLQVSLLKPSGLLIVPHARATKVVLIGAGTGIAAFLAYARARDTSPRVENDPSVVVVSLHRKHALAADELCGIAQRSGGRISIVTALSEPPKGWPASEDMEKGFCHAGRITRDLLLGAHVIGETPMDQLDIYFAGPPAMENHVGELLAEIGVPARARRRLGLSEGIAQRSAHIITEMGGGGGNTRDGEDAPLLLRHDNLVSVAGDGSSDDGSRSGDEDGASWWPFPSLFSQVGSEDERRDA